jgi:EmrB/QacA subfamily drug resistance transporter
MSSLDGNIVMIALPTIAKDLPGTTLFDLIWILIGYQLVTASVLINFGRLGDKFGRVRLYNFGFIVFTIGSALCALSMSALQLIIYRMIQAVGGSFLFANSAAILTDAFPVNERGKALGTNQIAIVAGSILGLVLGGILTTTWGWRSIFTVNIPIGIFATIWSHYKLKEVGTLNKTIRLDLSGNITLVLGLATLLLGLTLAVLQPTILVIVLIMVGSVSMVAFCIIETHVMNPMFKLSLFKIPAFAGGNVAIFMNSLSRGAVQLVLVLYLQGPSNRLSPLVAGLYMVPISLAIAAFGPLSGTLSDRYGPRWFAISGLLLSIAGFIIFANVGLTVTFWWLFIPLFLAGAGFGLFASPNRASIMNSVQKQDRGLASGTSATLVNIGGTLSLCIAFAILALKTPIIDLQDIFLAGSTSLTISLQWVLDFVGGIRLVNIYSAIFLVVALIPTVFKGTYQRARDIDT